MKKYKYIWLMVCFIFMGQIVNAQINLGAKPHGFDKSLKLKSRKKTNDTLVTYKPIKNIEILLKADQHNDSLGESYRFAYPISVNLDMNNSGEWFDLENGDRMWRLTVSCPDAKSIYFNFNKFWIPDGGSLHIYDYEKKKYIGPLTYKVNDGTKNNPGKFSNQLLESNKVILEYFVPKDKIKEGILSIVEIYYGYRDFPMGNGTEPGPDWVKSENGACSCYTGFDVDVNCIEGQNFDNQKTSVAKLVKDGTAFCSGVLINNVLKDGQLYFLTAGHCISLENDAVFGTIHSLDWTIYWNYENMYCENDNILKQVFATYGATVIANSGFDSVYNKNLKAWIVESIVPDFALLKLKQSPYDVGFNAYYSGWDRNLPDTTGTFVGISHPSGMPKKISISTSRNHNSNTMYTLALWSKSITKINQPSRLYLNSSGSPIYNKSKKVDGICSSGAPAPNYPKLYMCPSRIYTPENWDPISKWWKNDPYRYWDSTLIGYENVYNKYYRINMMWDFMRPPTHFNEKTINDPRVNLKQWLDPQNTDSSSIVGMICTTKYISGNYYENETIIKCKIEATKVKVFNNKKLIFKAANGVYIPSDFEIPYGSSFEINEY